MIILITYAVVVVILWPFITRRLIKTCPVPNSIFGTAGSAYVGLCGAAVWPATILFWFIGWIARRGL